MDLLQLISLILGGIGTLTGLTSLIWHILKDKPKLEINSFTYKYEKTKGYDEDIIVVYSTVKLRNKGDKDISLDGIYFTFNGKKFSDSIVRGGLPLHIPKSSSKEFSVQIPLNTSDDDYLSKQKELIFCIWVDTTYGQMNKCKIILEGFYSQNPTGDIRDSII